MKTSSLTELCKQDYNLNFLSFTVMPQSTKNAIFSCMSQPKKQDLLLYINDCSTQYYTKSKKILTTKPGELVYIPTGSEYTVKCIQDKLHSSTLQINFHLFDSQGIPIKLSEEILIFSTRSEKLKNLFEKLAVLSVNPQTFPAEQKAILYNILTAIAKESLMPVAHSIIQPGINYIHTHYHERPTISALAKLCYISPEYFRRLFEKEMGLSPIKYITKLRLQKALDYLLYSDLSIAQIGAALSYSTTTHFIAQFKLLFDITPLQYRTLYQ